MNNKICWIDVETTGLDARKQDVIQIAGIIDINGQVKERFMFLCQPHSWEDIQQKALDVHGYSIPDLQGFESPYVIKQKVEAILAKYINKFDKADKFVFAGYNTPFDYGFVREWFKKCGDKYFGSYFEYKQYDVYPLFQCYCNIAGLSLPNQKLITAAGHFGVHIDAHDALSDIEATRAVGKHIEKLLQYGIAVAADIQSDDTQTCNVGGEQ
jgi:DNA polymerase III subunit epsilon